MEDLQSFTYRKEKEMTKEELQLIDELRKIVDNYENDMISKKELIKTLKKIVLFEENSLIILIPPFQQKN
jgi:hypothetical protein